MYEVWRVLTRLLHCDVQQWSELIGVSLKCSSVVFVWWGNDDAMMVLLLFKSCWSGTSAVPALNCIPCSQTRRPGPSWLETSSSAFTSNSKSLQALPYNLLQFSWFTFYKESKSVQSKYYINFFSLINIAVCGNIGILVIELSVRVWCEARHGYLLAVTLTSKDLHFGFSAHFKYVPADSSRSKIWH